MKFFLHISFVFCLFCTFSQSPKVRLEVSNLKPQAGEFITIEMTSKVGSNFQIDFPDVFQAGMNIMSGMRQEIVNGRSNTIYFQTLRGFFTEEGAYTLGPVRIKSRSKTFNSNKIKISVSGVGRLPKSKKSTTVSKSKRPSIFAETDCSDSKIYRGEALFLRSSVYSLKEFSGIRHYTPYKIDAKYEEYKVEKNKELNWKQANIDGQQYLKLQFEENIIYPSQIGFITIEPFEMILTGYGSFAVRSVSQSIEVMELPVQGQPKGFSGLVGSFELKTSLSDSIAKKDDIVSLTIEVSGTGNLQQAVPPEPILPKGIELYADPIKTEKYELTEKGFKGNVIFTYPLRVLETRFIEIQPIEVAFFAPNSANYVSMVSQPLNLNASEIKNIEPQNGKSEGSFALTPKENDSSTSRTLFNLFYILLALLFCLALSWLSFFVFKRRRASRRAKALHFKLPKLSDIQKAMNSATDKSNTEAKSVAKMEDCLFLYCSYVLSQNSMRLSRNEIYLLLSNTLSQEKISEIRELFADLDAHRYATGYASVGFNELKKTFHQRFNALINQV